MHSERHGKEMMGQIELTGRSIIAGWDGAGSGESVRAVDPASGAELDPEFEFVTEAAVDAAASCGQRGVRRVPGDFSG